MLRALAALLLLAPSAVLACSIAQPFTGALSPADGATGVPLNARIRFIDCRDSVGRWTVVDESGTEALVRRKHRGPVTVLEPDDLLKPLTRYTFTLLSLDGETSSTTFTTGESVDERAPAVPGEPSVTPGNTKLDLGGTSCSAPGREWFSFTWPAGSDDTAPSSELFVEAMIAETAAELDDTPVLATQSGTFVVGGGICNGSYLTKDRATVVMRARAVDWAGNESALTEVIPVKNACGCSSSPASMLALAGLAALVRARRFAKKC